MFIATRSRSREITASVPKALPRPHRWPVLPPEWLKIKRKGSSGRRNAPGFKGDDFVPWAPTDTEGAQDLEEEEHEERMTGLLDRYVARKRKRQVSSSGESDTAPVQAAGSSQSAGESQPAADGSSGDRVIIIPCSPEFEPSG